MNILFSSICFGNTYRNLAETCILSYKDTNPSIPITWVLLCQNKQEQSKLKAQLSYLEDSNLKLKYEIFKEPKKKVDYSLYRSLGHTGELGCKLFINRIYYIDNLKKEGKYDILVTVDLDTIFIQNIDTYISNFISKEAIYGGTPEPQYIEENIKLILNKDIKLPYDNRIYINMGFGLFNLKKLKNNLYEDFINISSGLEDLYNYQDQSYFCYSIPDKDKAIYNDIQIVYYCIYNKDYNIPRNPHILHYSFTDVLFNVSNTNLLEKKYIIHLHYYQYFYNMIMKSRLPKNIKEQVKQNYLIISKLRKDFYPVYSANLKYFYLI